MAYRFSTLAPLLKSDSYMRILFMFGFTHCVSSDVSEFSKHVYRVQLKSFIQNKLLTEAKLAFHNFDVEYNLILKEFRRRAANKYYTDTYLESVDKLGDFGEEHSKIPPHQMIDRVASFLSKLSPNENELEIVVECLQYLSNISTWERQTLSPGLANLFAYSATDMPFIREASKLLPLTCNDMGGLEFKKYCNSTFSKDAVIISLP